MNKTSNKTRGGQYKISISEYPNIVDLYLNGKTHLEISTKFGVNKKLISQILKKNKIKARGHKYYDYNENFFSKIDSKEKAYFLGLMFTDGNIDKNLRIAKITLQDIDSYILDIFSSFIFKSNRPNLYPDFHDNKKYGEKRRKKYALKISSYKIVSDLISLGCIPKKSLILQFPNLKCSDEIMWHFIRGLIDGDGGIYIINKKYINISFTGSNYLVPSFQIWLKDREISSSIYKKEKVMGLRISSSSVHKFLSRLYSDSDNLRLNRKYDVYQSIINNSL